MSEQGPQQLTPYQEARVTFDLLEPQPFSPERYHCALTDVLTRGAAEGIDRPELFTVMERLTGIAAEKAGPDPSSDVFLGMQKGYKTALKRLQNPQRPQTPRPKTGIAAG